MKKLLLLTLLLPLFHSAIAQDGCIELFISEYVEGWSNNKAIELYNPTDAPKDLSNYRLERFSNGSSAPQENQKLELSGTIDAYSTFVIVIDKRDSLGEGQEAPVWDELQAKADVFECPVYDENNTMYFNGNDAMVLRNISGGGTGFVIDAVGRPGEDPAGDDGSEGWNDVPPDFTWVSNGAVSWTKDHSLIRKPSVTIGDLSPLDIFDVSVEWDSIPPVYINEDGFLEGNWGSLGNHDCQCNPVSVHDAQTFDFVMYPNPVENSEMVQLVSQKPIQKYEILDITGKRIDARKVANQNSIQIELSGFTSGLYLIKAYNGSSFSTRKMVVR